MYVPEAFEERRVDVMHQLIRVRPLATLITLSPTGLNANHIPLLLSESPAPLGTLRGHVARANPLISDIDNEVETLAVFHGPDAYITPSWYPTKKETGKVVPTWNYVAVHAYGRLRIIDDATWLRAHVATLTEHSESGFPEPWALSDAPKEHIDRLIESIVGVEMVVSKLVGKWKVSQNRSTSDRMGVAAGLRATGAAEAALMAALVEGYAR